MKIPLNALSREALDVLTDTLSDKEIGDLYELSRTAATYHRRNAGVLSFSQKHGQRKYAEAYERKAGAKRAVSYRRELRSDYFREIDSPEKAYWLGFLSADGWIVTEKTVPRGVGFALNKRDRVILDRYACTLGIPDAVRPTRPGCDLLQVKFTSPEMAADLIRHGVVPRKSKVIQWPSLPNELLRHFSRGVFDGDGSVGKRQNGSLTAQITTASEAFAIACKAWADPLLPRPASLGKDREAFVLRWYADNAIALGRLLYGETPGECLCLERKKRIFFG